MPEFPATTALALFSALAASIYLLRRRRTKTSFASNENAVPAVSVKTYLTRDMVPIPENYPDIYKETRL
jgi:hypothetical protein